MEMNTCRSCNAAIVWFRSAATNSLMPVDAVPSTDGNIVIVDGKAEVLKGELWEDMHPGEPRFKSHFASCPNAAKHRKKK